MKEKYESMTLEDQEIIAHINSYKSHSALRRFIKLKSIDLSSEVAKYARFKYLELKKEESRKYYEKNKENKISNNKYLKSISLCKYKSALEKYLDKDLNEIERTYLNNKLKQFEPKLKKKQKTKKKVISKEYKYLDIIDKCNNTTTLQTYKTFTDITKHELNIINNKIKKINQNKYKENFDKSYIQRDVDQQIGYQKTKDKMMEEFLSKGGKIKVYDFGL